MELPNYEELAERETDVDWDDYNEEKVLCGYEDSEDEELSKLLGYANLIQGDMTFECAEIDHGIYCGDVPKLSDEQREQLLADSNEWVPISGLHVKYCGRKVDTYLKVCICFKRVI